MTHRLLDCNIMHHRHEPKQNRFKYSARYALLDTGDLHAINRYRGVGYNVSNWVSFLDCDHQGKQVNEEKDMHTWASDVFEKNGLGDIVSSIYVMTMPRVCGYLFNPVSFWFGVDFSGQLRAVIAEVRNTFHERFCYLCTHEDKRPIRDGDDIEKNKCFYVSPFIEIDGAYVFRFHWSQKKVGVSIKSIKDGICRLTTSIYGDVYTFSEKRPCWFFINRPWRTVLVMILIHFQALKLWLKKVRIIQKPSAPDKEF